MLTTETLARRAYDAYGAVTDHKNYRGDPMPEWADLGDTIQRAWCAATSAVAGVTLRDMAERIDRGPGCPLPPSVYSALVRERAEDLQPAL